MNIFVGNLSRQATEDDVKQTFETFGKITEVKIIRDMFTRESKGFGFVEMPVRTEAEAAIQKLNATQLLGRPITVNEARPRPEKGSRSNRRW